MRHDVHFVEELSSPREGGAIGRMIDLDLIDVNPHQPRKTLGDLNDLVSSIKEKGLLEPILVRSLGGRFQIIAGERRYHASRAAGLRQIPCIEMEVDDRGVLEISLIENLQRRDLNPFEEADAVLYLCERFDYTHEKVAQKLSKSRSSITELLALAGLPEEVREECRRADISTKSLLIEIARQNSVEDMLSFIQLIARDGLSRDDARRMKTLPLASPEEADAPEPAQPRPSPERPYVFKFHSKEQRFFVNLRFDRPQVRKDEVLSALRQLIQQIEASDDLPG
ncbi:MAG TPA: ParB/RepB/Spo0J family partition protein [Candidatus Polarisedimenticolia bacterium]|nr:ParB/RepB/Spo0J family partition protein [Candidatus Polarisedimenticolia bacterium]